MNYLLDLHVHTSASLDGLSSLNGQAAAAKTAGLDAIGVTAHNLCTPLPQSLEGVLLIPGCELSTLHGHITGLFLQAPLDLDALRRDGLPSGGAAVEEIHQKGGIAVLAHPYQSPGARPEDFPFRPDCVEGANARAALKVKDAGAGACPPWGGATPTPAARWGTPAPGSRRRPSPSPPSGRRSWRGGAGRCCKKIPRISGRGFPSSPRPAAGAE